MAANISFDDLIPQTPPGFQDIRAPDGSIARFPASMSDGAIEAVMRKHYPAPAAASPQSTGGQDPYAAFSSRVDAQGSTGPGTAPYAAADPYAGFSSRVGAAPDAATPNPFDQFDGPWKDYQAAQAPTSAAGPWTDYAPQQKAAPNPFDQFDTPASKSPSFQVTNPADNAVYQIDAPDEKTAVAVLRQHLAQTGQRSAVPPAWAQSPAAPADPDAWQNPVMERIRQLTLGAAHAVAHPIDTAENVYNSVKSAVTLPGDVYTGKVDPMSDEGIQRAVGLAGFVSPANTIGAVEMAAPKLAAPTADALRSAASTGYDAARNMGVNYSADAVSNLATALRGGLESDGIIRELAPKSFAVIDKLATPPAGGFAPLSGLEAARRAFGNAAKDFNNPTDQLAAQRAREGLENFVSQPDSGAVLSDPDQAAAAAKTLQDARANYGAAMRSERLYGAGGEDGVATGVADKASLSADTANSGQNLDNAIRQRVKAILQSPKQAAGFSPEELATLNEVARGTASRNAIRYVGNWLGGGGGLASVAATGVGGFAGNMAGGPILGAISSVAAPLTGYLAKNLGNRLTSGALSAADDLVRQRSPLYQDLLRTAPRVRVEPTNSVALARALMGNAAGAEPADSSTNPLAAALGGYGRRM